jgi:hypothetical protein
MPVSYNQEDRMAGKRGLFFSLLVFLLLSGCGQNPGTHADRDAVVVVNNYSLTREEFENEFKASAYSEIDTPESRKNFLNTLIDRKLILQYAQTEGLDKEKNFLKSIEKFWEQSLLKIVLDKKTREIESKIVLADWQAKRTEEAKVMSDWLSELRKKARVTIKDGVLENAAHQEGGR